VSLQPAIDACLAEGFEIVQEGRVLIPVRAGDPKLSFSERVEGFNIHLLGYSGMHTRYDNRLFDDDERWVHLRREKRAD
jgi:hypothetical protein